MASESIRGRGNVIKRPIEERRFKFRTDRGLDGVTAEELAEDAGLNDHEKTALYSLKINEYIRINRFDIQRVR